MEKGKEITFLVGWGQKVVCFISHWPGGGVCIFYSKKLSILESNRCDFPLFKIYLVQEQLSIIRNVIDTLQSKVNWQFIGEMYVLDGKFHLQL